MVGSPPVLNQLLCRHAFKLHMMRHTYKHLCNTDHYVLMASMKDKCLPAVCLRSAAAAQGPVGPDHSDMVQKSPHTSSVSSSAACRGALRRDMVRHQRAGPWQHSCSLCSLQQSSHGCFEAEELASAREVAGASQLHHAGKMLFTDTLQVLESEALGMPHCLSTLPKWAACNLFMCICTLSTSG